MAVKQAMMVPVYVSAWQDEDIPEAYRCGACHGVYFTRVLDPDWDVIPEEPAFEVTCSLCNERAPLSDRYWMALATLAWAYLENGGCCRKGPELGFPSFDEVRVDGHDFNESTVDFTHMGAYVTAMTTDIEWHAPAPLWVSFSGILDNAGGRFAPDVLALEVVNRVRHDLELEYWENAGSETRALQNASRESR